MPRNLQEKPYLPPAPSGRSHDASAAFEPLLPAKIAAQFLGGIHVKTLQRMARANEVPSRQIGRAWFFRASELNQWLEVKSSGQYDRSTREE